MSFLGELFVGAGGVGGDTISLSRSDADDGVEITVTHANGETETETVYDGTDGQDGVDGQDGQDGADGLNGTDGQDGQDGQDGAGVPQGGSYGQVLKKASGTDYDTCWDDESGGLTVIRLADFESQLESSFITAFFAFIAAAVQSQGTPVSVTQSGSFTDEVTQIVSIAAEHPAAISVTDELSGIAMNMTVCSVSVGTFSVHASFVMPVENVGDYLFSVDAAAHYGGICVCGYALALPTPEPQIMRRMPELRRAAAQD